MNLKFDVRKFEGLSKETLQKKNIKFTCRALSHGTILMNYRGLKFVPLGFKRLLILQSVHKVKINLSSLSLLANLTLIKRKYSEN